MAEYVPAESMYERIPPGWERLWTCTACGVCVTERSKSTHDQWHVRLTCDLEQRQPRAE